MRSIEVRINQLPSQSFLQTEDAKHPLVGVVYDIPRRIYQHVMFVDFSGIYLAVKAEELFS